MGWNYFEMRGKFCIRSAEPDGAAPLLRGLRPSEVPAERSWSCLLYTSYLASHMVGDDDGEVPPVPIPNTVVKLTRAQDS